MIPRQLLTTLVFALPILVVLFGVVMGGYGLSSATGDIGGAAVLWHIAMGVLLLLATDLVLLIGVLGIIALQRDERAVRHSDLDED